MRVFKFSVQESRLGKSVGFHTDLFCKTWRLEVEKAGQCSAGTPHYTDTPPPVFLKEGKRNKVVLRRSWWQECRGAAYGSKRSTAGGSISI